MAKLSNWLLQDIIIEFDSLVENDSLNKVTGDAYYDYSNYVDYTNYSDYTASYSNYNNYEAYIDYSNYSNYSDYSNYTNSTTYYTLSLTHWYVQANGEYYKFNYSSPQYPEGTTVDLTNSGIHITESGFEYDDDSMKVKSVYMDRNKSANIMYKQCWPFLLFTWGSLYDELDHGYVKVNDVIVENTSKALYEPGSTVKLEAFPDEYSFFEEWNTGSQPESQLNYYTVPAYSKSSYTYLVIAIMRYPRVTATVEPSGTGSVSISIVNVPIGQRSTLVASPTDSNNVVFKQWQDGVTSNRRTVTVYSDMSFTAYFKLKAWAWSDTIAPGQPISNLTANDWNNFTARINKARRWAGFSDYVFTTVTNQTILTHSIFNEAVNAINDLPYIGTIPTTKNKGDNIMANYFEGNESIKSGLNNYIGTT